MAYPGLGAGIASSCLATRIFGKLKSDKHHHTAEQCLTFQIFYLSETVDIEALQAVYNNKNNRSLDTKCFALGT